MLTEQQKLAVDMVDCNILVSAGAGSGKTHVLVERYVEILRRYPESTLGNIIAVTFTRKAASEMRARLKARFLTLSQEEAGPEASARWRACLSEVDGARIGTIHSLCESILKSHPSDCGIDPQFEVLDELAQNEMLEKSIAAAFREVIAAVSLASAGAPGQNSASVIASGLDPGQSTASGAPFSGAGHDQSLSLEHDVMLEFSIEDLKKLLMRLVKSSMQFRQSVNAMGGLSLDEMYINAEKFLRSIQLEALSSLNRNRHFNKAFDYVRENSIADPKNSLVPVRQEVLALWHEVFAEQSCQQRWAALVTVSERKIGNIGGTKPEAKSLRGALTDLRKLAGKLVEKVPASLNAADEKGFAFTLGIIRLFERANRLYQQAKLDLTALDYNDLISLALSCLEKEDSLARAYFNEKLQALLVDEFQDTNDLQATLLSLLAGSQTRIFLIGDDKQSIYKFQGADVATFNKWKSKFRAATAGSGAVFAGVADAGATAAGATAAGVTSAGVTSAGATAAGATAAGATGAINVSSAASAVMSGPSLVTKLTRSFRSHPDVVHFVNGVFSSLLDGDPDEVPYVAAFEALEPARTADLPASAADLASQTTEPPAGNSVADSEHQPNSAGSDSGDAESAIFDLDADASDSDLDEFGPDSGDLDNDESGLEPGDLDIGQSGSGIDGSTKVLPQNKNAVEIVWVDNELDDEGEQLPADLHEARQVGLWLQNKVDTGYRVAAKSGIVRAISYGDCAVLVSRNRDFAAFEDMFARLKIPYVTFGGTGFLRRQEVADFENLFRFLDNPRDSHSLLAVLRSPFCALTDDLIHRVQAGVTEPLWTTLVKACRRRVQGYEGLSLAVSLLRGLMDYAALLPLGELTQKIIAKTGYDLAVLAAPDGQQRSRNVWKIAYLAREQEHLSCGEFAGRLSLMRQFGMQESEAPLDSTDAVKLMTVHASKGLEFPIVALPSLSFPILRNSDKLVYHPSYGVAFNTKKLEEEETPSWYQIASYLDRQMEREERKRLLYVAMTRARDNLGLFMRARKPRAESYRQWLIEVLSLDEDDAPRPAPGEELTAYLSSAVDGTVCSYSLTVANARENDLELSSESISEAVSLSNIDLSLCEPILSAPADPTLNERGLLRITPANVIAGKPPRALYDASTLGTFFHSLMENLPPSGRRVDRAFVSDIAFTLGASIAHPSVLNALVDEGERLLNIYFDSRLAGLLAKTAVKLHELPYFIKAADGERLFLRRPDLIFEDERGEWQLVDYKTDQFGADQVDTQARKHREQIKGYIADLERLTGRTITPWIYFAQHGIFYPL